MTEQFSLDLNSLLNFLNRKKLEPQLDSQTGQIQILLNFSKREIPVIFNLISEGLILQSIAYLPITLPKKHLNDISRLLHILNKQLDLPGFGMDEKHELIFFRVPILSLEKTFSEELINVMLGTTELACDSFLTGIEMIANGSVSLEKTLQAEKERSS